MTVSVISFWLPLLWALFVAISWRFMWKEPINHWLVCAILGFVCFFWFAITLVGYLIALAIKYRVFASLRRGSEKTSDSDDGK